MFLACVNLKRDQLLKQNIHTSSRIHQVLVLSVELTVDLTWKMLFYILSEHLDLRLKQPLELGIVIIQNKFQVVNNLLLKRELLIE